MKFRVARTLAALALVALAALPPAIALAQPQPSPQQYEDALRQLQQSQDRKNQLAEENAKLAEENAQLRARLAEAEASERMYFLRAHYAAWQTFMDRYPLLLDRFQGYLSATNRSTLSSASADWVSQPLELIDADWPFSAAASLVDRTLP